MSYRNFIKKYCVFKSNSYICTQKLNNKKMTIGQSVISKKNGNGTITKIITKSTGYVEVTYTNGKVVKEMAFNLTDDNGNSIKALPKKKEYTKEEIAIEEAKAIRQRIYIDARLNYALQQETGRTGSTQFLKSI